MSRATVAAAFGLLVVLAGCGASDGVSSGATVVAYVEVPLCAGADRELRDQGERTGDLRVRVVCLPDPHDGQGLNPVTLGSNARRATEDSTTVAFLGTDDLAASRFTRSILDEAGIALLTTGSGATAMSRLLRAIRRVEPSESARNSVFEELG